MSSIVVQLGPDGAWGTYSLSRLFSLFIFFGASLSAIMIATTGAIFTDSQAVSANTFTAGTVDISTTPSSAVVAFSNMAPGDTSVGELAVDNDGSLEMRYAVTSVTTENVLAAQLDMTIKTGVTTCSSAGYDTDGTIIYGPADFGSTGGTAIIGDPAQGAQAGDRVLGAATSEDLCIRVSLPLSTGNSFQGLTTSGTLTFDAEQTANN